MATSGPFWTAFFTVQQFGLNAKASRRHAGRILQNQPTITKQLVDVHHIAIKLTETLQHIKQEAQLMLTTGSTRLAVSRGQQTWYHSTCNI